MADARERAEAMLRVEKIRGAVGLRLLRFGSAEVCTGGMRFIEAARASMVNELAAALEAYAAEREAAARAQTWREAVGLCRDVEDERRARTHEWLSRDERRAYGYANCADTAKILAERMEQRAATAGGPRGGEGET